MRYLTQGKETTARINILLSMTKITGERKIKALHHHFVKGLDIGAAAAASSLPQPNLTEVITTLNEVAESFEKYYESRMLDLSSSLLQSLSNQAKIRESNK